MRGRASKRRLRRAGTDGLKLWRSEARNTRPSNALNPNRRLSMFVLRYIFKTVILGLVTRLLGRYLPILLRILRLWR